MRKPIMGSGALLSFAAFALGNVIASAQQWQLPPGMTLHHMHAGKLDTNGWTVAVSSNGGYSLKTPCKYNDYTRDESTDDSGVLNTFVVGCLRSDQRKFAATRFKYREGAKTAKEVFERNASPEAWDDDARLNQHTFKGLPALDVILKNVERCGFQRFILLHTDMIQMVTEAPVAMCEGLALQSKEFLDSLNVDAK